METLPINIFEFLKSGSIDDVEIVTNPSTTRISEISLNEYDFIPQQSQIVFEQRVIRKFNDNDYLFVLGMQDIWRKTNPFLVGGGDSANRNEYWIKIDGNVNPNDHRLLFRDDGAIIYSMKPEGIRLLRKLPDEISKELLRTQQETVKQQFRPVLTQLLFRPEGLEVQEAKRRFQERSLQRGFVAVPPTLKLQPAEPPSPPVFPIGIRASLEATLPHFSERGLDTLINDLLGPVTARATRFIPLADKRRLVAEAILTEFPSTTRAKKTKRKVLHRSKPRRKVSRKKVSRKRKVSRKKVSRKRKVSRKLVKGKPRRA